LNICFKRLIAAVAPHVKYNPETLLYDMLIVKTMRPFLARKNIKPIQMAPMGFKPIGKKIW